MNCPWPPHIRCWPRRLHRVSPLLALRARVLSEIPIAERVDGTRRRLPLPMSRVYIIGRWTAPDGVVHARVMGSGVLKLEPHERGLRTLCMKPWKWPPEGPACPEGLRRVDFMDFTSRVTCESCVRSIDRVICGEPPKRADGEAA